MTLAIAVAIDDDVYCDVVVHALRRHGFRASAFHDVGVLYQRLQTEPFDVVVLDVWIKYDYGLDVVRHLRSVQPSGIVVLATRGMHSEQIRSLLDDVDRWLENPVKPDVLTTALQSFERRVRLRQAQRSSLAGPKSWRLSPGRWRLLSPDGRGLTLNALERWLLTQRDRELDDLSPSGARSLLRPRHRY